MSNNNLSVILWDNQIRCCVEPSHALYKLVPKTEMINKTKLKNRIIVDKLIPYKKVGKLYLVPRFMPNCLMGIAPNYHDEIRNYENLVSGFSCTFDCDFSEKKQLLIASTIEQLDTIDGALLQLGTGKGKTAIANKIIHHYQRNSVIIVYNEELQTQADADIKERFGDKVNIILIGGKKTRIKQVEKAQQSDAEMKKYLGNKLNIFVCVYQSSKKLNSVFWKYIYLAIFDECHCYCNNTGVAMLETCKAQKILGMTATPNYDWRSKIAEYWCGPIVSGDTIIPDRKLDGKVTVVNFYGCKTYTEERRSSTGTRSHVLMAGLLGEDPTRNKMIVQYIDELISGGYVIIIMASCNDMLLRLDGMIKDRINTGLLIGPTPKEERVRVKKEAQVIFTNYAFSRVGVNIPRATAMIFASPYKENGTQINGRILRSDEPILRRYIDIVDRRTYLSKQFQSRIIDYTRRNFEIEYVDYK